MKSDKIYISISNPDNFEGLIIPKKFEGIVEMITNFDKNFDIIDATFDDYKQYRDYEIEYSRNARHGTIGSKELVELKDILEYFEGYDDELDLNLIKYKGVKLK